MPITVMHASNRDDRRRHQRDHAVTAAAQCIAHTVERNALQRGHHPQQREPGDERSGKPHEFPTIEVRGEIAVLLEVHLVQFGDQLSADHRAGDTTT
jgi:hypothetical protein